MNTRNLVGIVLATCLVGAIPVQAQPTNSTQQILQMESFQEGLVWVGDQMPAEAENKELLEILNHLHESWWTSGVEQFLRGHPQSPWAASLRHDYAMFCRSTGRTSKALEQWATAWPLVRADASPTGQKLAGTILANWMDLLSSLGRLEKLKELVAVGDQWHFASNQDRDMFEGAKNSYYLMSSHPGIAYRCGTFALKAVGLQLQPDNHALENLVELPSPTNGFSLASLVDMAKHYKLNLTAARRTAGQDLIVPSVVHWRQNHYAAILQQQGDLYLVNDPTFGGSKWMPATVINEEASGEFLIPVISQTNGWTELARTETEAIRGMGLPNNINDAKDKGCGKCAGCAGMPVAWVSEPYINLWLADEPVSYLTASGEPFTFRLTYKQRDSQPQTLYDVTSRIPGWEHSWSSRVRLISTAPCSDELVGCSSPGILRDVTATLYLAGGGTVDFSSGFFDAETRLQLLQQGSGVTLLLAADGGNNGLRLVHPDGSQEIYGLGYGAHVPAGSYLQTVYSLTRHIDAHGRTTWFNYGTTNLIPVLTSVVDPDGRTNTLKYSSNALLLEVVNPYGFSAKFKYDASGNLTNITDAQGLVSSVSYDANHYPTALVTPYGTNKFEIFVNATVATENGQGNFGGHDLVDRAVRMTDPVGATSLYLYRYDESTFMATTYATNEVPTGTPLGTLDDGHGSSTNGLAAVCFRNSFYWDARQYPTLSTTNFLAFPANDYVRGRMRHWLQDTNDLTLSGFVSVERAASPDGTTEGLKTFYDYPGKIFPHRSGANPLPSVTAWRLPGGETHYQYDRFDAFGNVTNSVETCTLPDGTLGTRTNQLVYARNYYTNTFGILSGGSIVNTATTIFTVPNLLTQVIGADGQPLWTYGGFDTVTWTNYFNAGNQTNGVLSTWTRVMPRYVTNGVGQVATFSFTGFDLVTSLKSFAGLTTTNFYSNPTNGFLLQTIDLEIGRTNSYGYTANGLISTYTNALGLNLGFTWDNLLRQTGTQFPDGTASTIYYNKLDFAGSIDRQGVQTVCTYDKARHRLGCQVFDADFSILDQQFYSWCGCGALTSVTDALGNLTTLTYDNAGRLTGKTFPDGSSVTYQLDLAGRMTNMLDGAGRFIKFALNHQGLATNVTDALNHSWRRMTYDLRDRPVAETDANGVTVTNTFDALNRLTKQTWPDGGSESAGYSPQGLAYYTNRNGKVSGYGYNAAGWLMAATNANLEVTRYTYNPIHQPLTLTDGLNHTRTWQYNEYGWLTNKTDGLGRNAFRYQYNLGGSVINVWTPEKGNLGIARDGYGRARSVSYNGVLAKTYDYDRAQRLTNFVDNVGTTKLAYTPAGRLASEDGPWANDTVGLTYSQGLRTLLTIAQPSGTNWTQTNGYDAAWRLTNTVTLAGGFIYNYLSSVLDAPSSINLPNGATITNTFDSLARLTSTALKDHWGHTLDGYTYTPDALGLRTNIFRNIGLTNSTVSIGYDNIGQLTSWTATEGAGIPRLNEQLGYGYDAADNLHTRINGGLTQTFTVDAANQLSSIGRVGNLTLSGATPSPALSVTVNGLAAQLYADQTFARTNLPLNNGNNTFTNLAAYSYGFKDTNVFTANLPVNVALAYDNNGNLTNDGTKSYGYDAENQMTNVFVPGQWKSEYVYDGLNRRRINKDYIWTNSAWLKISETRIICDGMMPAQERDTNNNVLVTYTRGLDMSGSLSGAGGIGGLLARTDSAGSIYYHQDGVGNVTALMDGIEDIVARYMYDPFGKIIRQTGPMATVNVMQFSGKPRYHELDDFGLRWLTRWGRWLNQDPIQEAGGINLYGYAGNNPINEIDPLGTSLDWSGAKDYLQGYSSGLTTTAIDSWRSTANLLNPALAGLNNYAAQQAAGLNNSLLNQTFGTPSPCGSRHSDWYNLGQGVGTATAIMATLEMGGGKTLAAKGGVNVASRLGGEILPATLVRTIQPGEKVAALESELAQLTYTSEGLEHAVISLQSGERVIVSGGSGGINFGEDLKRVLMHTHPTPTGPSAIDFQMLEQTGQQHSYIYELFGGGRTRFDAR